MPVEVASVEGDGWRYEASVVRFYDEFAADYHLAYGGNWESAVERQAAALDRLIRDVLPDGRSVLDCSCGIGTQAIGLARLGYRVTGTDVSAGEIAELTAAADDAGFQHIAWPADRTIVAGQRVMTANRP
jgi:2-polyprenyl-3-methyl-5-hydroxy-6-metoxy-1,4-benzoquinol methylase